MMFPISVIVPHKESRRAFLSEKCLPAIMENSPAEVIVIGGGDTAGVKRNRGAAMTSQPFLFFCDDDIVLGIGCLERMFGMLQAHDDAAFVYSDREHVVHFGVKFPTGTGAARAIPWNADRLRQGNYISMMSLIRSEAFPGFDPGIWRFEDWDLWLTIVERGGSGVWVNEILFESHHIDDGLTMIESDNWLEIVKGKHGIR